MAKDFTITIDGLKELQAALRDYPKIADPIVMGALRDTGEIFTRYSQLATRATLPQKTGTLRSSFTYQFGKFYGRFFPDPTIAPYAVYVHEGTRPHIIRPKNARVLAFQASRGSSYTKPAGGGRWRYNAATTGGMVFTTEVHHPGTRPYPFMRVIAQQATPDIMVRFRKAYDDINTIVAQRTNKRINSPA